MIIPNTEYIDLSRHKKYPKNIWPKNAIWNDGKIINSGNFPPNKLINGRHIIDPNIVAIMIMDDQVVKESWRMKSSDPDSTETNTK